MREIVIGDDFPFTAQDVTWERNGSPIPTADLTWSLEDEDADEVASGTMTQYDALAASYEGVIPRAVTVALVKGAEYYLLVAVEDDGIRNTFSLRLRAVRYRSV